MKKFLPCGKPVVFEGAATAIITPFKDGKVDFEAFGALIESQITSGIDGIVVCGTTGEASTLTDEEHRACIAFAVEKTAGRVPVIAGTGSNDTDYAVDLSKFAASAGVDAVLTVTPYYNKATPRGLIKSFTAVADVINVPVILYNVPSRTGVGITTAVYRELAKHDNIVAVKEAGGNFSAIAELAAACGDTLAIYSGNDDQIVPMLSLGGRGVISVLSNIMPAETSAICRAWREGRADDARRMQLDYLELINALFCEVNPIPVKTAAGMLGICSEEMRLPLCEMEDAHRERLAEALRNAGLLK